MASAVSCDWCGIMESTQDVIWVWAFIKVGNVRSDAACGSTQAALLPSVDRLNIAIAGEQQLLQKR